MLVPARAVVLALSLRLSRWVELTPQRSMLLPLTLRLRPVRPPTLAPSPRLALLSRVSATEVVSDQRNEDTEWAFISLQNRLLTKCPTKWLSDIVLLYSVSINKQCGEIKMECGQWDK